MISFDVRERFQDTNYLINYQTVRNEKMDH